LALVASYLKENNNEAYKAVFSIKAEEEQQHRDKGEKLSTTPFCTSQSLQ